MPPVANDTERRLSSQEPQDESILGLQFASEEGDLILDKYLRFKANTCQDTCELAHRFDENNSVERSGESYIRLRKQGAPNGNLKGDELSARWDTYFEDHMNDAMPPLEWRKRDMQTLKLEVQMISIAIL